MEMSPCWKTKNSTANRKIPCILWNQNVHYRAHNSHFPLLSTKFIQVTLSYLTLWDPF